MPYCCPVPATTTVRALTKPPWTRQLWWTLQQPSEGCDVPKVPLVFYWLVFALVCPLCLAECPYQCECKWKSGKETVECKRAGFMVMPNNLDTGTQVLDVSYNNLQVLPKDSFLDANLIHLQKIFLVECSLSQIDKEAFRSLSNLVELDISSNDMTYIPSAAIREVPQMRRLSMNSNPLKRIIKDSFSDMPSLETLELSHCNIDTIEVGAFKGLKRLTLLKLDGNRLHSFSYEVVVPLVMLHALHLHDNPWNCDCHLSPLRQWLIQHNIPINVPPTCVLPQRFRDKTWSEIQLDEFVCEPHVAVETDATEYLEGDNITFTCHAIANPEPTIWWTWQGKKITNESSSSSGRLYAIVEEGTTDKTSKISVTHLEKSDSGMYVCVAENGNSVQTGNVTLRIGREAAGTGMSNEGDVSVHTANLTFKADSETTKGEGLAVSHITGIVIGITVVIILLIVVLCTLIMWCKNGPKSDKDDYKRSDANNKMTNSINHRDTFLQLEEQDKSLLGPNPIQKPPRLGQYHGVPTFDVDHYDKVDQYMANSVPTQWNAPVVVEFAAEEEEDDDNKCTRPTMVGRDEMLVLSHLTSADEEIGDKMKDTCLRPIVEESVSGSRESEEGDDSGLELDRVRETEMRSGFSDGDSDKERLQEKNKRNQEKRTPLCPRDPSAIERELMGGVTSITPQDRLRHNRQLMQRGGSGGGGDSTCSSSDPPTVPSSPQRQTHLPATDKVVSLIVPSILLKQPRNGRPSSLEDEGEDGTEV